MTFSSGGGSSSSSSSSRKQHRQICSIFLRLLLLSSLSIVVVSIRTPRPAGNSVYLLSSTDLSQYNFPVTIVGSNALAVRGGGGEERKDSDDNDAIIRAQYVKELLLHRLDYVCKGRRMQDFHKWVVSRGGEATIFSMHGLDNNVDFQHVSSHVGNIVEDRRHDPFPEDRLNLDIVATNHTPSNMFPGEPQHLIDSSTPNVIQLLLRAANLGIHFAPAWSTVGLAYISPHFRQKYWYKWLAKCIGSSGAAWIKWGQWSSTRNDMFPDAFCDELAMLHNDAPAHSWQFSELQMESSLGLARGSLKQVFDSFDERPLASGSIAQVHRAVLGDKLVAVKIRHPRVAQLIDMDFRIMSMGAKCLDLLPGLSWLRLRESVDQFSHTMAAQAHLHVEGHHLEVLNHNFCNWPHVSFPKPFYASSSVIIETFEPGKIVTNFLDEYDEVAKVINERNQAKNDDDEEYQVEEPGNVKLLRDRMIPTLLPGEEIEGRDLVPMSVARFIVTTGAGIYLKMLLVDNLMHADLHPGNIMLDVRRSKTRLSPICENVVAVPGNGFEQHRSRMAITLVDAGMVAQLTPAESSAFIGLLASLGSGNGKEAAHFALQFSEENLDQVSEQTKKEFEEDMVLLFKECCRGYGTGVDVGEVLRGVLGLIREHHIRIDANYATLVVNVLCIESLAKRMFPAYNVLDAARPLLKSYRQVCYTNSGDPKPEARRSKLVKLWLSLMYLKKEIQDSEFFKRQARQRRRVFFQSHATRQVV